MKNTEICSNILLNTFVGNDALFEYLNPNNNIPTPLVELPESFNKYKKDGVRIFAKLMNTLPLGNVKSLPALNMLIDKNENGGLKGIDTIIENSSGNTVFSLSVLSKYFGISNTKAVVSHEVSLGKLNLLRFLDTEIIVNKEPICPDPKDPDSGIYKAKVWAKEKGWFNPGQYDNKANPDAHYKWTAPQIWQQTSGKIDVLVSCLGTTGTIYGIGKFLKERNIDVKIVGIARALNNPIPGPRTKNLLKEIAFNWKSFVDEIFEGDTKSSYKLSMQLSRSGVMVGPSSGLSLLGVYKYLENLDESKRKNLNIVFICPDSPLPYIEEYFEVLGESEFPKIENKELLLKLESNKVDLVKKGVVEVEECSVRDVYRILYEHKNCNLCFDCLGYGKVPEISENVLIVDVRNENDFYDHHIFCAKNIQLKKLEEYIIENKNKLSRVQKIICVCKFGVSSRDAVKVFSKNNLQAVSMVGGMSKWSEEDFPRVKPKGCAVK